MLTATFIEGHYTLTVDVIGTLRTQRLGLIELAGENAKNYNLDIINADCELNVKEKKILSKFNSLSNFDQEDLINFVNFDKEIEFNYLFPNDKEKIMGFAIYSTIADGNEKRKNSTTRKKRV